ncbi:MAG: hypothetical protein IT285_10105 [Bdellovibrionales bacterium]|nr:hypothetical protein [Bdellovibrionales bacterium]
MRLPTACKICLALLVALTVFPARAEETRPAESTAARIVVRSESDPSAVSYFEVRMQEESGALVALVFRPANAHLRPRRILLNQITSPSGVVVKEKIVKEEPVRPVVRLMARPDDLDGTGGGRITLRYLVSGRGKTQDWRFGDFGMRVIRTGGDTWEIQTDDQTPRVIRTLCFRKKTFWGFEVGISEVDVNVQSCS